MATLGTVTQQQRYEVLATSGDVEIRRHLPHLIADVVVDGDFGAAGNRGFRALADYIFSNNIAMTAPVIAQRSDEQRWEISFVMPEGSRIEEMPAPNQPVQLRAAGEEVCAVLRFSGYTSDRKVESATTRLLHRVRAAGLQPRGEVRVARFDPPWKPGFARHNEVIVPIVWPGTDQMAE